MTNKEAKFFEKLDNQTVRCTLCPNYCTLKDNQRGICNVRINHNGVLYTEAYNNLCALNIDPIEKKPLFHFLPNSKTLSIAFGGCNLKCPNCQNFSISQATPNEVEHYNVSPQQLVQLAIDKNLKSISYTYTEPLISYEYTLDTAILAHNQNLKNIIVSAGYINEKPLSELAPYIDAANIDIKSFDEDTYKKINKASLNTVLNTVLILKKFNVWIELTYLLIPSINDDFLQYDNFCKWLHQNNLQDTPLHISKFHPTYKMQHLFPTPNETIINAVKFFLKNGIKYVYSGNLWGNEFEKTYCPNCKKIIVDRTGYLVEKINIKDNKCIFCGSQINILL